MPLCASIFLRRQEICRLLGFGEGSQDCHSKRAAGLWRIPCARRLTARGKDLAHRGLPSENPGWQGGSFASGCKAGVPQEGGRAISQDTMTCSQLGQLLDWGVIHSDAGFWGDPGLGHHSGICPQDSTVPWGLSYPPDCQEHVGTHGHLPAPPAARCSRASVLGPASPPVLLPFLGPSVRGTPRGNWGS